MKESGSTPLVLEVLTSAAISPGTLGEIRDLCTEAYAEDFTGLIEQLGAGVHVLGRTGGTLVSHAMWIMRWLKPAGRAPLRTAYVEAVATKPTFQGLGFASTVLMRLANEIRDFQLGALSPSDERFYARLGWQPWQGPLFIRHEDHLEATPEESIMILRLPGTPADLDLGAALSAEWRPGEVW